MFWRFLALAALVSVPALADPSPLTTAKQQLADSAKRFDQTSRDLTTTASQLLTVSQRIHVRGRQLYLATRGAMAPTGAGLAGLATRAEHVAMLGKSLRRDLDSQQKLLDKKSQLASQLDNLAVQKGQLESEVNALEERFHQASDDRERREAFDRAFATSSSDVTAPNAQSEFGPSSAPEIPFERPSMFRARKGHLTFPLAQSSQFHEATRDGELGVDIVGKPNSPVRAVFHGRVAFADSYGALGTVIIIDHGEHYYTLMANLGSIAVHVGDVVDEGQTVATTNPNGGPMFFEIRHALDHVSPLAWLLDKH